MNNALNQMRINYDNVIKLGNMSDIHNSNPILKRRQNKKVDLWELARGCPGNVSRGYNEALWLVRCAHVCHVTRDSFIYVVMRHVKYQDWELWCTPRNHSNTALKHSFYFADVKCERVFYSFDTLKYIVHYTVYIVHYTTTTSQWNYFIWLKLLVICNASDL